MILSKFVMELPSELPPAIELVPHPHARDQAVARSFIKAGSSILTTPTFACILIDTEKGRRCDHCFRLPQDKALKRCTGCGSYWYCDVECEPRTSYLSPCDSVLNHGQVNVSNGKSIINGSARRLTLSQPLLPTKLFQLMRSTTLFCFRMWLLSCLSCPYHTPLRPPRLPRLS